MKHKKHRNPNPLVSVGWRDFRSPPPPRDGLLRLVCSDPDLGVSFYAQWPVNLPIRAAFWLTEQYSGLLRWLCFTGLVIVPEGERVSRWIVRREAWRLCFWRYRNNSLSSPDSRARYWAEGDRLIAAFGDEGA